MSHLFAPPPLDWTQAKPRYFWPRPGAGPSTGMNKSDDQCIPLASWHRPHAVTQLGVAACQPISVELQQPPPPVSSCHPRASDSPNLFPSFFHDVAVIVWPSAFPTSNYAECQSSPPGQRPSPLIVLHLRPTDRSTPFHPHNPQPAFSFSPFLSTQVVLFSGTIIITSLFSKTLNLWSSGRLLLISFN